MKSLFIHRRKYIPILFIISFVYFIVLMYRSPLISDDIEFSSMTFEGFRDVLRYALYYGNGRLLGNFSSQLLCHSTLLRIIVKAGTISLVIVLLPYVINCRIIVGYLLSFILIMAMPAELFGEVFVWTSGFTNYVTPICLTLIILCIIEKLDAFDRKSYRYLIGFTVFILGIASQLYVEHSSIINLILACCSIAANAKKQAGKQIFDDMVGFNNYRHWNYVLDSESVLYTGEQN